MEKKDSYRMRVTEPTVVVFPDGERRHVAAKEEITVDGDAAHNLIAGGKGVMIDGELPNSLKGTPGRSAGARA